MVGKMIRGTTSPMVYYYAANGKRYVFTTKDVLASWYNTSQEIVAGSSSMCYKVQQLSDSDLAAIPIGGNVNIRPGTYLIKITSDPKLYVVTRGRVIRPLANNDLAAIIFPGSSSGRIRVVPDAFFTGYSQGQAITAASDYNPTTEYSTVIENELGV